MKDILNKPLSKYLSYKEEYGRLKVLIESPITVVNPNEKGLDGIVWNPPITDRDGNPIIERFGKDEGKPMKPWAKVEVQCKVLSCSGDKNLVDDSSKYFRIGSTNSGLLKAFIREMKNNEIDNNHIVGTKWTINGERDIFWTYHVEYLGIREDN